MRLALALVFCLARLPAVLAGEPSVDAVFSQKEGQNIIQFMASITADEVKSISSVVGDEHDAGVVPREVTQISRDGTQSPGTMYLRTDLASVLTADKNQVLTEYKVRKGAQGWALEIERFGWYDYPAQCLWYLLPGLVVHLAFFALGCFCLLFVQLYARSGYRRLLNRWGLFNVLFFLVACAVNGLWSCLIFGHFYTSIDYVSDFSPLLPITQGLIDARLGYQVGHLYGITLRQLQLLWMAFAALTWVLALFLYFLIRRRAEDGASRSSQPLTIAKATL